MEDYQIRLAAFDWLKNQAVINDNIFSRNVLSLGFIFEGNQVPLVSPQGIFKPKICNLPLTITSTTKGPYIDVIEHSTDLLLYKYRGTNPLHRDNVGLRKLMETNTPLIYFLGLIPGKYLAVWPVYIIGDDTENFLFRVAVDAEISLSQKDNQISEDIASRRKYITSTVRLRLHQSSFREKVILAYSRQCAFCQLRHIELLDAAHIIPDADPLGAPIVNNGIALCKIHHAAFDRFFLAITPNYQIIVRNDLLQEEDGPMLEHGLQSLHRQRLHLPKSKSDWPNQSFLEKRYTDFVKHV
ncbi:MAG: HNH endonuclease [FCB group bacterium]|nr:HNH endonuclease [FCB group bacterium]